MEQNEKPGKMLQSGSLWIKWYNYLDWTKFKPTTPTKFMHKIFKEHFVTSEIGLLDAEEKPKKENMKEWMFSICIFIHKIQNIADISKN